MPLARIGVIASPSMVTRAPGMAPQDNGAIGIKEKTQAHARVCLGLVVLLMVSAVVVGPAVPCNL